MHNWDFWLWIKVFRVCILMFLCSCEFPFEFKKACGSLMNPFTTLFSTCALADTLSRMACRVIEASSGHGVLPRRPEVVSVVLVLWGTTENVPLSAVGGKDQTCDL